MGKVDSNGYYKSGKQKGENVMKGISGYAPQEITIADKIELRNQRILLKQETKKITKSEGGLFLVDKDYKEKEEEKFIWEVVAKDPAIEDATIKVGDKIFVNQVLVKMVMIEGDDTPYAVASPANIWFVYV